MWAIHAAEFFIYVYVMVGAIEAMASTGHIDVNGFWQTLYAFAKPLSLVPTFPFVLVERAGTAVWLACTTSIATLPYPWDAVAMLVLTCFVITLFFFLAKAVAESASTAMRHASSIVSIFVPFTYSLSLAVVVYCGLNGWSANTKFCVSGCVFVGVRVFFPAIKSAQTTANAWLIAKMKRE